MSGLCSTALHIAVCDGHLDVCKVLVDNGGDMDFKDRWNHSPYDEAVNAGHSAIVTYFDTMRAKQASEAQASLTPARVLTGGTVAGGMSVVGGDGGKRGLSVRSHTASSATATLTPHYFDNSFMMGVSVQCTAVAVLQALVHPLPAWLRRRRFPSTSVAPTAVPSNRPPFPLSS